jgi:hypothetical protein
MRAAVGLVVLPLLLAPAARQAQPDSLPVLFFHASLVRQDQMSDALQALRAVIPHVREKNSDVVTPTLYLPVFWEGEMPVFYFVEVASIEAAMNRYASDGQWQSLDDAFQATVSAETTNQVLIPLEGRHAPAGATRAWRTSRVAPGKYAKALEAARALTEHVNSLSPDVAMSLYVQERGPFGQLHWFTDFSSLDAWAAFRAQLLEDARYLRIIDTLNPLMEPESTRTEVLDLFAN